MKDFLKQTLEKIDDKLHGLSVAREYLQARILQGLQDCGAFRTWVFHGGTSLRFLYHIPRYSEDLDFALRETGLEDKFTHCMKQVKAAFEAEGYDVDVKANTSGNTSRSISPTTISPPSWPESFMPFWRDPISKAGTCMI